MRKTTLFITTVLTLLILVGIVTANKFSVPPIFTVPIGNNMTCSDTFLGQPVSSIAVVDRVETGLGTSSIIIGVTLPFTATLPLKLKSFVLPGLPSLAPAQNVGIFYMNMSLKNVTQNVINGSVCGLQQLNFSAIANASNNFEGWYAYNDTICNNTYSQSTTELNLSRWASIPSSLTFPADQTVWFQVVTNYKPVLGYTAYDTYLNISGFVPCFAWQNTSYTFRKNLTIMNGYAKDYSLPIFINGSIIRNATQVMSNCSDVKMADDFNGEYPISWNNCNQTGSGFWVAPNITAGANWSGNASTYYNGTPSEPFGGALVFKNFTAFWDMGDMNDSRGINNLTSSNGTDAPLIMTGSDGLCTFGRCWNVSNGANLTINSFKMNSSSGWTFMTRFAPVATTGDKFLMGSGNCDYNSGFGFYLIGSSTLSYSFKGQPTFTCGTMTAGTATNVAIMQDAGGTTCFRDGANTSFTTTTGWTGSHGWTINRGGVNNGLFTGGCGGWLTYTANVEWVDFVAFSNQSFTSEQIRAFFNTSTGLTTTSEGCLVEPCGQQAVVNIVPLVTLISPANAAKLTTGTLPFQFNWSDNDSLTSDCTMYRNATNASFLASVSANFTATMNISTHSVGNFTWNITCNDGVDSGNSSKQTYMVVPANTAPTVTVNAPANALKIDNETFINFTFTPTDDENATIAWCRLRFNITGFDTSYDIPQGLLANISVPYYPYIGNWSWFVRCSDGIIESDSSSRAMEVTPINTAPTITLNSPADASVFSTRDVVNFTFTPSDIDNATLSWCAVRLNSTTILGNISSVTQGQLQNVTVSKQSAGNYSWNAICSDVLLEGSGTARSVSVNIQDWWQAGNLRYVMEDFASPRTLNWTITNAFSVNQTNLRSNGALQPSVAIHNFSSNSYGESIKLANFTIKGFFNIGGGANQFAPLFVFTSDNISGSFDTGVNPPSGGSYLYLVVDNERFQVVAGANGSSVNTSIAGAFLEGNYTYVINRTMIEPNVYNTTFRLHHPSTDIGVNLSLRENTTNLNDGFQVMYFGGGFNNQVYDYTVYSFNLTTQNFSSGTTPNLPPFIVNISVFPATANTSSTQLSCRLNVTDDLDTLVVAADINWFNNTVNMSQFATTSYILANEYELAGNISPAGLIFNHNWSCSAQAHDNAMLYSGRNLSKNVTLAQGNTVPALNSISVSPASITVNSTAGIGCKVNVSDVDTQNITMTISWFNSTSSGMVNVSALASNYTLNTLVYNATNVTLGNITPVFHKGGGWMCGVYVSDGVATTGPTNSSNITVSNLGPFLMTTPSIVPSNPGPSDRLNCTVQAGDLDNASVQVNFTWFRNGVYDATFDSQTGCTNASTCYASVLAFPVNKNQAWICSAVAYDGIDGSGPANSSAASIGNALPNTPFIRSQANVSYVNFTFLLIANTTDPDGDNLSFVFLADSTSPPTSIIANVTVLNGTMLVGNTTFTNFTENLRVYWRVNVSDGSNSSNYSDTYEFVINSLGKYNFKNITPSTVFANNTLNCSMNITDVNNATFLVNWTWYKNGVLDQNLVTTTCSNNTWCLNPVLINASQLRKTDVWTCGAITDDAIMASNATNVSITIQNNPPTTPAFLAPANGQYVNFTSSLRVNSSDIDGDNITFLFFIDSSASATSNEFNVSVLNGTAHMEGNASYTNLTQDRTIYWRLKAFDKDNTTLSYSSEQNFIINSLGTYNAKNITPSPAFGANNLNCSANITDTNNATFLVNWTWFRNQVLNQSLVTTTCNNNSLCFHPVLLNESLVSKGDNWTCQILVDDAIMASNATNVTINISDSPPRTSSTATIPLTYANTTVGLNCTTLYTDQDLDTGTVTFSWLKNGTLMDFNGTILTVTNSTLVGTNYTIPATNTSKYDNWTCQAYATSSNLVGNTTNATIQIPNSKPIFNVNKTIPVELLVNSFHRVHVNVTDPDEDAVLSCLFNVTQPNGIRVVNTSTQHLNGSNGSNYDTHLWNSTLNFNATIGGVYNFSVECTDGENASVDFWRQALVKDAITISNYSFNSSFYYDTGYFTINITTDQFNISNVRLNLTGPTKNVSLTPNLASEGPGYFVYNVSYDWNQSGLWSFYMWANNSVGNETQGFDSFTVTDTISYSPFNFSKTLDPREELVLVNVSIWHDSNQKFTFNLTLQLENLSTKNFGQFNHSFELINLSVGGYGNLTNPANKSEFRLQANSTIADGLYTGNITLFRLIDNSTTKIPVLLGINPPAGKIEASNSTGQLCDSAQTCKLTATLTTSESTSKTFTFNNTGNFTLTNCTTSFTNDFAGISWISITNPTPYTIAPNASVTRTIQITNPTNVGTFLGYVEVACQATVLGFTDRLSKNPINQPIINVVVTAATPSGGTDVGGGGGAGDGVQTIVIKPANLSKEELLEKLGPICGNGACDGSESPLSCAADCRVNLDTLFCLKGETCAWKQAYFGKVVFGATLVSILVIAFKPALLAAG